MNTQHVRLPSVPCKTLPTAAAAAGDIGTVTAFSGRFFSARQHICYSALYAIARSSVCLSVRPSVTRVDQSKTLKDRIVQLSPQSSPMTVVS